MYPLLSILALLGVYIFSTGFLTSRSSLSITSQLQPPTLPPKRVLWLIIDALRHDFAMTPQNSTIMQYHSQMPVFKNTKKGTNYKFIADPPTTTSQRIKALTTGTLPTFIDFKNNFGATQIESDSLLRQMRQAGKKSKMMGDDTWVALFGDMIDEIHPFPSFEVYDLETVDNGVIKHLFPLPDADFTIAHFLGVDHAGHRYGPNHPEMARKLRQMNGIVERVIEELPEDTVLMVWGDHGMNSVGDHGGESEDEVTAALFIYPSEAEAQTVPQIDLVPTTAYLLQIPIPVENLGKVITGIFPPQDHLTLLQHNAQQIHRYLQLIGVKTELPNTLNEEVYERYIIEAQATARTLWATFDKRAIAAGICLLTIVIGVVLWQTLNIRDPVSVAKSIPVWQYLQVLVTAIYVFSLGAVRFVEFEDHLAALAAVIMIILSPSPLRKKLTAGLLIIGTCYITCCRVEQGPTCHSTYQASTTPIWVLYVIPFVAIAASDDFEIMLQLLLICIYWARPSGVLAAGIALLACLSRTTRRTLLTLTMLHQTPISGAALMAFLLQSRLVESSPWLNFVLAHHYYFRTGHQATLSSLQWTSAFVFTSRVIPIINGISIVLNTFGPIIVVLTTNVKFLNTASWRLEILPWMIATAVTMVTCGMLRRHLLVWPIFAPRFMLAASFLICAELVLGIIRHCNKIGSIQDGLKAKDEVKRAIQSQEGSPTG